MAGLGGKCGVTATAKRRRAGLRREPGAGADNDAFEGAHCNGVQILDYLDGVTSNPKGLQGQAAVGRLVVRLQHLHPLLPRAQSNVAPVQDRSSATL